jgi:hypothetical protein
MTYNKDTLRAGLDTFTKPDKPRYKQAFKDYDKLIDEGATPKFAVEHSLAEAAKGLPNKQNKLDTALIAAEEAQLPEPEEPVQPGDHTFTIKLPTLHRTDRKTTTSKVHADDEHTLTKKSLIGFLFVGFLVGLPVGGAIFLLLWFFTPSLNQGVRDILLLPILLLSVVMCMLIFYRKAIAPLLVHDDEDEKDDVVSPNQSPSSERGFEGKTA